MPDEFDLAQEHEEIARAAAIRNNAKDIQPGEPGECFYCGEESQRLINNACAPCRDRRKLP